MNNPKVGVVLGTVVVGLVLFVLAFLVFGKSYTSMACVIAGISIMGWGVGYFMDTPCPATPANKQ